MSILIYLFPALIDGVVAQMLFVNTLRAAQMGCRDVVIACLWTAWSIPYIVLCTLISRWLSEANAGRLLVIACALMVLAGIGNLTASTVTELYVWSLFPAVAAAFFFPPFQVFMKRVDRGQSKPITWSTGLYTFSWSTGFAVGPWLSGYLMETGPSGWKGCFIVSACVAGMSGVVLAWLNARLTPPESGKPVQSIAVSNEYAGMPDLAWLGWVGAGGGLVTLAVIRSVFPAMGEKLLSLPESVQGNIFFLLSMAQALTGLALVKSRTWMYRVSGVGLFGLSGLVGTIFFAMASMPVTLYMAAIFFGIYSGSFYFYFVFHALAHPRRAPMYVSINEIVVGITSMLGPLAGGLLADLSGSYPLTFLAAAGVVGVTVVFQMVVHSRVRPNGMTGPMGLAEQGNP